MKEDNRNVRWWGEGFNKVRDEDKDKEKEWDVMRKDEWNKGRKEFR